MKSILSLITLFSLSTFAEIEHKNIDYNNGQFEGYISMPKKLTKKTPAIILVHNWMGVSDETRYQADRFAQLGYVVLAADIYGKGQRPKDPKEAGQFAGKYKSDRKLFRQNLVTALEFLKSQKDVDTTNIAAVGYCFGGTGAIELARTGADIKAVVSFHGGLDSPTPADGKNIKAKLLIHHGAIDPFVPAKDVEAFEKELNDNHVKYELVKYPGAVHSFTDKGAGNDTSKGAAYNEDADKKSFAKTKDFLKQIL